MKDNDARQATFLRIVDGDTFDARVRVWRKVRPEPELHVSIRVHKWYAAELREGEGPFMRDEFEKQLRAATLIDVKAVNMSHHRVVCDVYLDGVLFVGILRRKLKTLRRRIARANHSRFTRRTDGRKRNRNDSTAYRTDTEIRRRHQ